MLLGTLISAVVAGPGLIYLGSPIATDTSNTSWIDLGPLDKFAVGTPTYAEFTQTKIHGWERTATSYGVFVVRPDSTDVRVFSNICTHLGCRVSWHADIRNYVSPCHDGHFDIVGRNISGPPPRPLDEHPTRLSEGKLYIRIPPFRRMS